VGFEFATANRILFGEGMVREAPAAAASMGRRALVVTGASPDRAAPLIASLKASALTCILFAAPGEPTIGLVRTGAEYARMGALRSGDRDRRRQRHRRG